jgi:Protein of unknown function (DUF5661)
MSEQKPGFSTDRAREIGERIGIDWDRSRFDVEQFRMGLGVELEHGRRDPETNVSDDDELTTGKIAARTSTSSATTTRGLRRWKPRPSSTGPTASRRQTHRSPPRVATGWRRQPRSARSALRMTARSMTSWNRAPATGGRYPAAATAIAAMLSPMPVSTLCRAM